MSDMYFDASETASDSFNRIDLKRTLTLSLEYLRGVNKRLRVT